MGWLHHVVLHFPLALAPLGTLYMLWSFARREKSSVAATAARWTIYFGALSACITAATGLAAAPHLKEAGIHGPALELHRNVSLAAALVLVGAASYSFRCASRRSTIRLPEVAASCLGSVAVMIAGHFGGELLHPGMAPWSAAPHVHQIDGRASDVYDVPVR